MYSLILGNTKCCSFLIPFDIGLFMIIDNYKDIRNYCVKERTKNNVKHGKKVIVQTKIC